MRFGLDEVLNQNHYIDYTYDNLNRLTDEENYNSSSEGYESHYTYDLAGNRTRRIVTANNQTLTTDYIYHADTDRLLTETNTGPVAAIPYGDNQRIYAYANAPDGVITYQLPDSDTRIGQFSALFHGLPSVWNAALFYAAMILIPVTFFWPVFVRQWSRLRGSIDSLASLDLRLWHRCLCVLLAYIFLVGPELFHTLSQAAVQHGQISTLAWGKGNTIIEYGYDFNGSLTSKTTTQGSQTQETVVYTYNLQNRLETVTTTPYIDGSPEPSTVTAYTYDPSGIRTSKTVDDTVRTDYIIDPANHTGYAQVLEEWTTDITNPPSRCSSPPFIIPLATT